MQSRAQIPWTGTLSDLLARPATRLKQIGSKPSAIAEDAAVSPRSKLNGFDRVVALVLAVIWLVAGLAGFVAGITYGRWLLGVLGLLALAYAALWLRVVMQSRLLTWRGIMTRWRSR
jgi:hypothetical protein